MRLTALLDRSPPAAAPRRCAAAGPAAAAGRRGAFAVALAAAMLALLAPAEAATPQEAASFVEDLGDRAIDQLSHPDVPEDERAERFRQLLNEGFDVPAIGRFVLGRYWRSASEQERRAFLDTFERVLVQRFLPLFDEYSGEDFEVDGARADSRNPNRYVVESLIRPPGGEEPARVQWRLRENAGKLHIVDVVAEGVSMAITLRSEYNSVVRRQGGDVSALVAMLEEKLAEGAFAPDSVKGIAQ